MKNLYEISKTLRFELKPTSEKEKKIIEEGVFFIGGEDIIKTSKEKKDNKTQCLELIDKELLSFSNSFFQQEKFNNTFRDFFKNLDLKNKEAIKEIENYFFYNIKEDIFTDKKIKNIEFLFWKQLITYLLELYKEDEDKKKILNTFNKDSGYLDVKKSRSFIFLTNKDGSILKRIFDNYKIFSGNLDVIKKYTSDNFLINYSHFLQEEIDMYNEKIWELNIKINENNQKNKEQKKEPVLKKLQKQILTESVSVFEYIESKEDAIKKYNSFILEIKKELEDYTEILKNLSKKDLKRIYLSKKGIDIINGTFLEDFTALKKYKILSVSQLGEEPIKNLVIRKDTEEKLLDLFLNSLKFDIKELKEITDINREEKESIYEAFTYILNIYRTTSYFQEEEDIDLSFYKILNSFIEKPIVRYFNLFRNFLSRKEYEIKKTELTLNLDGWSDGWARSKSVILRKGNKFYLWIFTKGNIKKNIDKVTSILSSEEKDNYQLLEYNQTDYKNVILGQFSKDKIIKEKYKKYFPSLKKTSLWEIMKQEVNEKVKKELIQDLFMIISKYAQGKYVGIDDMLRKKDTYTEVEQVSKDYEKAVAFSMNWKSINIKEIEKNLLLFQIYSKDLSKDQKTKKDLQAIYFEYLLSDSNIQSINNLTKGVVYKLDGMASVYFRKKSIEEKEKKIRDKSIIEKRRYTKNKLLFHTSIKINYGLWNPYERDIEGYNKLLNQYIVKKWEVKFLGIDRGERNLIYISLVDKDGKIIKGYTKSLNGKYKDLLLNRENEMKNARKEWWEIKSIKELKEGYISSIIREIIDIAIKENAIIVLEDLSSGFKNMRKKVDRSIYDKFEKGLLKKLNYYFDKESKDLTEALQLTPYFWSLSQKIIDYNKQLGLLFYIPAAYTSQACPNCWFIKNNYFIGNKKDLDNIESIERKEKGYIFIYKDKTVLHTEVERLKKERKNDEKFWSTSSYNITQNLDIFLKKNNIEQEIIKEIKKLNDNKFKEFKEIISKLFQLRNSNLEREISSWWDIDYISCPSCLYDMRNKKTITLGSIRNIEELKDSDANGAYHIARKGKILFENIMREESGYQNCSLEDFQKEIKK